MTEEAKVTSEVNSTYTSSQYAPFKRRREVHSGEEDTEDKRRLDNKKAKQDQCGNNYAYYKLS